jgi:hypothetical protein
MSKAKHGFGGSDGDVGGASVVLVVVLVVVVVVVVLSSKYGRGRAYERGRAGGRSVGRLSAAARRPTGIE